MGIFTMLSTPLCLPFFFLCLKTAFSSSLHASSFSTTHLCSHEEAAALLQFKTSFSIDYTICYTEANYSKTESWKEGIDCCSWDGVSCDNVTGHVIALDLGCSHLSGTFPSNSTLFLLKNLESLNLAYNDFRLSKIPPEIRQFTRLKHLDISSSRFSGQVPAEIAQLPKLVSLNLAREFLDDPLELILEKTSLGYLSGQIPSSLANLTQLTSLDLFNNQFSGPIPASIGNLSQLTDLRLCSNNFTGQIPPSLANLTQLNSLCLSYNHFSGPIPASIGNLSQLTFLSLSDNLLNGTLPPWIFTLPLLEYLYLDHNQFQGQINQFQLNSLINLDLSNNELQGSIPNSIGNSVNLSYLALSSNHFSLMSLTMNVNANFTLPKLTDVSFSSCNLSEFPNFLRHSNGLQTLGLSKNSIHGNIPEWICEKDHLEILDLSHNNLIGKIPNCLPKSLLVLNLQANYFDGNIPFGFPKGCGLRNLNLHGNQMDGLLPRSLVNCRMLEVLDVGNNNISDTFPHWLESLPELQVLVLRSNKFHSSVQGTKESPSFPKLRVLDLSSNDFLGPLPLWYMENFKAMMDPLGEVGSPEYMEVWMGPTSYHYSLVVPWKGSERELQGILTVFSSIHLSNNMFEGEIPDIIGKLSSLKGLNLSHNNLTGHIPQSLGNLTNLEWLDLSSNELAGKIPDELVSLTQLSILNLSNNHLVGRIPQGNQFNTFENGSYEGNLGLCGIPLSKSCDGIGTRPSSFQEKDELWRFGWRVVVLGYGCGVVFGLLMGYHVFQTGKPKWFVSLFDGRPNPSGRKMRKARRLVERIS